jgi:Alginate export
VKCITKLQADKVNRVTRELTNELALSTRFILVMTGCVLWQAALTRGSLVIGLFVLAASACVWGQTVPGSASPCLSAASTFPLMTYDEDNQYLANPDCRSKFVDRFKFVPLRGNNEDYYVSFGTDIRERGEYFSNPNWGTNPPGNAYLLQRYYLHTDLHLGRSFRFFGELGSGLETGRNGGPRPVVDEDRLDVHQAFVDVGLWRSGRNSLTLRTGRQEMAYGDESLVSSRDGRNVRRSFDGFRLTGVTGDWTVDTFAVRQSESDPGIFDDFMDHTTSFWGVYAVRPFRILPGGHVDLYYMGLDNKNDTYDKGSGREQRETIGTRLWGQTEHWDYNQEYTFQWGRFGSGDILAWAAATETGYRLDSVLLTPRFSIKADAFSGDHDPSGLTLGTFNPLYEMGPYFSYAELFGKRNLIDLQPSVRLSLSKKITLTPNTAFYWRESTQDGLYSVAAGAVIVSGQKSSDRYIGSHAAAQLKWAVNRHTTLFAEYLHFFPAGFLKQSTQGRNINYLTEWIEFRF